ncbi:hypothetical protein Clacol_000632 [Clathrus columnatus]|uniref:Uncharacterized protein n=1 Tax=Clathrus columnatus TaxID=1419009 RepID=A0AAV5A0A1_9AGAM|nr:hypothetical protein Clacol_000632 [Clathrus columnatus]
MSTTLARQRVLSTLNRTGKKARTLVLTRCASTGSHSHHHEDQHDSTVYPEESFNTPFWRATAIAAVIGFGAYKVVPLLDEDGTYITRYIQQYRTSPEVWNDINSKHLKQTIGAAEDQLVTHNALRPVVHRLRHPATMEYASARNVPVGVDNVLRDVVVKRDESWS